MTIAISQTSNACSRTIGLNAVLVGVYVDEIEVEQVGAELAALHRLHVRVTAEHGLAA